MSNVYPFVANPVPAESLVHAKPLKALKLLEEKGSYTKLTKSEKEHLSSIFNQLWNPYAYETGKIKTGGWIIDFTPYMKTFLVNVKHYGWKEVKSFNKTCIRQNAVTPSHILEIVEKP